MTPAEFAGELAGLDRGGLVLDTAAYGAWAIKNRAYVAGLVRVAEKVEALQREWTASHVARTPLEHAIVGVLVEMIALRSAPATEGQQP